MYSRNPYPNDYSLAFAFSAILYPQFHSLLYSRHTQMGKLRAYRVRCVQQNGEGLLYPPVVCFAHDRVVGRPCTHHIAFWRKPISIFGLFTMTTFIEHSHTLTIPFNPSPIPPDAGRTTISLRFW